MAVVDTNVVANLLLASFPAGTASHSQQRDSHRAIQYFQDLQANGGIGVVTPTVFTELIHVLIKARYRHEINTLSKLDMQRKYGKVFNAWNLLYKDDPAILQNFKPQLNRLKMLLMANGLLFLEPDHLGQIVSGRKFDDEMIELATKYGLNSNDARILIEVQCCGLTDIVSFDKDIQRASADFTVYTWL